MQVTTATTKFVTVALSAADVEEIATRKRLRELHHFLEAALLTVTNAEESGKDMEAAVKATVNNIEGFQGDGTPNHLYAFPVHDDLPPIVEEAIRQAVLPGMDAFVLQSKWQTAVVGTRCIVTAPNDHGTTTTVYDSEANNGDRMYFHDLYLG